MEFGRTGGCNLNSTCMKERESEKLRERERERGNSFGVRQAIPVLSLLQKQDDALRVDGC